MNNLIDRQAAIDRINGTGYADEIKANLFMILRTLPSAQPPLDEWCTDCKEYDREKHCCPRWNRVIRTTLQDAQTASKDDVKFWKDRAEHYSRMVGDLAAKMEQGVKFDSMTLLKNGNIAFTMKKPEQTERKWIPVSERLPKSREYDFYLVTKVDKDTLRRSVDIAFWGDYIKGNNGFHKADKVIAWMALPEPYKEGEDG